MITVTKPDTCSPSFSRGLLGDSCSGCWDGSIRCGNERTSVLDRTCWEYDGVNSRYGFTILTFAILVIKLRGVGQCAMADLQESGMLYYLPTKGFLIEV
jgi:hypothetical protein